MQEYQEEDWQEEKRKREEYYRRNCQQNTAPDALELIFRGSLNWMNLLMIGINVLVFGIMEILGSTEDIDFMVRWGASSMPLILEGEWYRIITSMFLHFGFAHLVNNMLVLLFMGDMVEEVVGHAKYLLIYLGSGIAGNLLSLYLNYQTQETVVSAGASGAIYGVIGAVFVILFKNRKIVRENILRRLLFVVIVTIYYGSQAAEIDNAAHLGGLIAGVFLAFLCMRTGFFRKESVS